MAKEKVLCIKRNNLPKDWIQQKSVIKTDIENFIEVCSSADFDFRSRELVETDPSFKQVIPYIVIQTIDLEYTAIYRRAGSEERLHDLWSVGIGGHINPVDNHGGKKPFDEILISGMERELDEELLKRPQEDVPVFTGVINEEITDVGSVHIGAVFKILTHDKNNFIPGEELVDFSWERTDQVYDLNLELWSKLAIELIEK